MPIVCGMDITQLRIRLARTENLPVLPRVAELVLKVVNSEQATRKQLEEILCSDPAIAAKLLRVANSPFYRRGDPTTTLERAISVLGVTAIKSLVLGVAYCHQDDQGPRSREFNRLAFWEHSIAVGAAAQVVASRCLPEKAEELYLAGLLHDIGLLVLDRFLPVELDAAISKARRSRLDLLDVESSLFGWDHAQIGALLIQNWGLEPMLRDAVLHHRSPLESDEHFVTTAIVGLGNTLAHHAGFRGGCTAELREADEAVLEAVGLERKDLDPIQQELKREVKSTIAAYVALREPPKAA